MKKLLTIAGILTPLVFLSMPVLAETTVTVDDNKVTIDRNQPTVVVTQPVIVAETEDPRKLEGEIIRVDIPESQIVVQDINSRERKVLLKQGMINAYKVGDYVQIYLMADLKEAKTIHTVRTADLEGDVVATDYTRNQVVIHDAGGVDRVVILSPGMSGKYQVRDHVRLYVVSDYPDFHEVRVVRVK